MPGHGGHRLDRPGGRLEEQVVEQLGARGEGAMQRLRHRAGDEEVRHGQQPRDLLLRPGRSLPAAAARARPVVAGVVAVVFASTVGTAVALPA